jgi:8-oxo-dGTP pyrophosphatase MutT (NUDIX family)
VLRDGPAGLETLLMLRPVEAEFAPRAQVFPGGRIDEGDADSTWQELSRINPSQAARIAEDGEGDGLPPALAFRIGAIREVFEETTVLLGIDGGELPSPDWAAEARARVHGEGESFAAVIREAGLALHPGELTYFARWVTPEQLPKRYDTRFYAAAMPAGQGALAAAGEVESLEWITPRVALARADTNEAYTLPPTRAALTSLAEFADVAGAIARLPAGRDLTPILPRIVSGAGPSPEIRVVLPGEPGYEKGAGE